VVEPDSVERQDEASEGLPQADVRPEAAPEGHISSEDPEFVASSAVSDRHQQTDRSFRRVVLYAVVLVALVADALILSQSSWGSSPSLHTLIEVMAAVTAFFLGALSLIRYHTKGHTALFFIGAGFLGTGLLDGYHALVTSTWFPVDSPSDLKDLMAWSWLASRTFLATCLLLGWFEERWGAREARARPFSERVVYLSAFVLPFAVMAAFAVFRLPAYVDADASVPRRLEWLAGLLFLGALAGYLQQGRWRREVVDHWVVVSLLLAAMGQFAYMAFSVAPHDPLFDGAHLVKLLSYLTILAGLMGGVYVASRREEEAMEQIQMANAALAREIAVRRSAEQVLLEGERRLQDFLDNANDLILSTAPDGRIIYVNRAWKETLGYLGRPMEGLSIYSVIHPASRERVRRSFEEVVEGESVIVEVEFMAADGRVVICAGSTNCRFEDDRPVAVRSIFRDVTEQKRAEARLELSQANLQALVENTGDAIWSVGRDLRLITFNSAYALEVEALTGREPRVSDPPDRVVPSDKVEWMKTLYNQALSGRRFSQLTTEEVAGQPRTVELFFNPIQDQRGTSGVAVFGKDVTPKVRAEEALRVAKDEAEMANLAKSRFLANMSHELRTPLNSVIGFANVLLKNKTGALKDKELTFIQRIVSNGRHLLNLINEVLDLAKIEAGRMDLEVGEVDLGVLAQETVSQLEGQVRDRPVELRTEVAPDLRPVETDAHKVTQVLINLVGNAVKFTEEGSVTVSVQEDSSDSLPVSITVTDTGIGIPPERLEAIFEAFQQADSGTSRRFGGSGLGLTISRSMVQLLGGDLFVESEEGKGSIFTLRLPRPPARSSRPGASQGEGESEATEAPRPPDAAAALDRPEAGTSPHADLQASDRVTPSR
jgi:PAS domain S-box-containing protein